VLAVVVDEAILITDRGAIAPGVGGTHERTGPRLNNDTVSMSGPLLPWSPTIEEMPPVLQFDKRCSGKSRLYV
jgi:hypothetical protein